MVFCVALGLLLLGLALLLLAQPVDAANLIGGVVAGSAPPAGSAAARAALYELAATRYGLSPSLLRALHQVESSGTGDGCLLNYRGSGATGPLQFKPVTFKTYAVDGDGDGRTDICGLADSLCSAGRYLQALGADADPLSPATYRALQRYGTDPARVTALARSLTAAQPSKVAQ
jgi:membrane-bound lytic murein transglycosylase B